MNYELINLINGKSHGTWDSLEDARGAVIYDRLISWRILVWNSRGILVREVGA